MRVALKAASAWPSEPQRSFCHCARAARPRLNPLPAATPGRRVQRLVNKADFERLLAARSHARSTHFSLHHVAAGPWVRVWLPRSPSELKLSTDGARTCPQPVDEMQSPASDGPDGLWLGCVVPKRHAKRAVTRNCLKRQVRGAFQRHAENLPDGLWLVRLRAPFVNEVTSSGVSGAKLVSARSQALIRAARGELDSLLGRASA
jgi:ribonuclease P protein component